MNTLAEILVMLAVFVLVAVVAVDSVFAQPVVSNYGPNPSVINEHPGDVISALVWVISIGGGAFFGLLFFVARSVIAKLNGIESALSSTNLEIKTTNKTLNAIERDIREEVHDLRAQVQAISVRCDMEHGAIGSHARRKTDKQD